MEGIAALSLACSVFQVIGFSKDALELWKQNRQQGATINNQDLEARSRQISEASKGVRSCKQKLNDEGRPLTAIDRQLQDLAIKCAEIANILRGELAKLKKEDTDHFWTAAGKFLRTIWRRNSIESMAARLERHQRMFESSILAKTRYVVSTFQGKNQLCLLNSNTTRLVFRVLI